MPKVFPIGKRPRKPFPKKGFMMFLDEFGYYSDHWDWASLAKLWSGTIFSQNCKIPLYTIPSFGEESKSFRHQHPLIQQFFRHLRIRALASAEHDVSLGITPKSRVHLGGRKKAQQKRFEARVLRQQQTQMLHLPPCSQAFWQHKSLLCWAVEFSDWPMVKALLQAGFDPNLKTPSNSSAMERLMERIRSLAMFDIDSYIIPHSVIWMMFEKGGDFVWKDIFQTDSEPPEFLQRLYEDVQSKLHLEKLPKTASHLTHKTTRI